MAKNPGNPAAPAEPAPAMQGPRPGAPGFVELQPAERPPVHVQEGVYRADKVLFHGERLRALQRGEAVTPVTAHLVISDLCNHNCEFCSFRMEDNLQNEWFGVERGGKRNNNPDRMIPADKVCEILDDMAELGVRGVEFTGGGEPTMHPARQRIFEHCTALGLDASLITNGHLVTSELHEVLGRFLWVRFSIDAATPATYARIRRVRADALRRVLHNAEQLIARRDASGSGTVIGAGLVVYRENWREVRDAVRLYKEIGFDNVRLGAMFNSSQKAGHFDDFVHEAALLCRQAKDEFEDDRFRVADNFVARIDDLRDGGRPGYERCYYQDLVAYVGGDQCLYRCCDTAYNPIGYLGSLVGRRFRDVWHEVTEQGLLRSFRPDHSCEFCMFNNRNLLVGAHVADPSLPLPDGAPPPHENFV